jgi:hypothetical protein
MQSVDDKPETIHLYVVREEDPKPPVLSIILSALSLAVLLVFCVLTPYQQPEVRIIIRVPAVPLSIKTFSTPIKVIPTGIKVYPATTAHGVLTITNGSIISQTLPKGLIVTANNGVEAATDSAVYVPAGSAEGYGISTVLAHLLTSGIDMSTFSINQVIGTSLYIRNLQAFTGGKPAYSKMIVTAQDKLEGIRRAYDVLMSEALGLHYPCSEAITRVLTLHCQFVTYNIPSYMHVIRVTIQGKNLLIKVWFVVRPTSIWVK